MKKQSTTILMLFGLILTLAINPVTVTYGTPTDLGEVEVRQYQGENLSSIDAFRENSIRSTIR
ncbi:MAG: hypothetical protein QCH99_07400 [Candidatus Bathyarchaeota archaeon]|nr:hypothetical protein [Candidatus Bathyarchaeum tardum]WGM90296.1 MAG: hypothetical protein NUK63_04035 [Candidatus Bathyarchaeum tardum]